MTRVTPEMLAAAKRLMEAKREVEAAKLALRRNDCDETRRRYDDAVKAGAAAEAEGQRLLGWVLERGAG